MRKQITAILTAAALGAAATSAQADSLLRFRGDLSGAQESANVDTEARGDLDVRFTKRFHRMRVDLKLRDLTNVTGAHFHCARPGEDGPIVFSLEPLGITDTDIKGSLTNEDAAIGEDCATGIGRSVDNLAALAHAMRDGLIYVNVHTDAHGTGEIRAQVRSKDTN